MPLAPAWILLERFPVALRQKPAAHGISEEFIEAETADLQPTLVQPTSLSARRGPACDALYRHASIKSLI